MRGRSPGGVRHVELDLARRAHVRELEELRAAIDRVLELQRVGQSRAALMPGAHCLVLDLHAHLARALEGCVSVLCVQERADGAAPVVLELDGV